MTPPTPKPFLRTDRIAAYQNRSASNEFQDWTSPKNFFATISITGGEYRLSSPATGGERFRIDGSKVLPRFVKVKARLAGDTAYVPKLISLEGSIEKAAKRPGHVVNLECANSPWSDAISINAISEK